MLLAAALLCPPPARGQTALPSQAPQGWGTVAIAYPPGQAREFFGLDFSRPETLAAFSRVMVRSGQNPGEMLQLLGPEAAAKLARKAALAYAMSVLSEPGAPAEALADLNEIRGLFPEDVRTALGSVVPKAESLSSLGEARSWLESLKAPSPPQRKAAIEELSRLDWDASRKAEAREAFLSSRDSGMRKALARLFLGKPFGFRTQGEIVSWLYPGDLAEIRAFHPGLGEVPLDGKFLRSIFADPPRLKAWARNARAVREASPEAFEEWAKGGASGFGFVVEGRPASMRVSGLDLPYALPGEKGEARPGEPERVVRMVPKSSGRLNGKARALFSDFDRLIEANFQALEFLSSVEGNPTRASAERLVDLTRAMAELFSRLLGPSDKRGQEAQKALGALQAVLEEGWSGLRGAEPLPSGVRGLALDLNPSSPFGSLHSLINWMHQAAIASMTGRGGGDLGARGTADIIDGNGALETVYLGSQPPEEVASRKALRGLLSRVRDTPGLWFDTLFFDENRLWIHAQFGTHTAEVFADLSDPGDGGLLRIRYKESGYAGSGLRLKMIAAYLRRVGMDVKIEGGDRFLSASWDKDNGLSSGGLVAESLPEILRFLHQTENLDFTFNSLAYNKGVPGFTEAVSRLGDIYFAEGGWPFDYTAPSEKFLAEFQAYEARAPERTRLREKLQRELARLGLPPMPEDFPFGQKAADRHFTRAIEEAAAREEISWDGRSPPTRNPDFDPIRDIAALAASDGASCLSAGAVLRAADERELAFEVLGAAGALSAERAQKRLSNGGILTILALRDPLSGSIAFARASQWTRGSPPRELDAEGLEALLRREGFSIGRPEAWTLPQHRRLLGLLKEPLPRRPASRETASGIASSPGKGAFSIGPLSFDRSNPAAGAILAVPFTTPDDLEALSKSAGVITTGGGALSHAAITTRELGIPSAILPSASWGQDGALAVPLMRWADPTKTGEGLQTARLFPSAKPRLKEGDLVRVYGRTGEVELLRGAHVREAYEALEGLRGGGDALAWGKGWNAETELFLLEEARFDPRYSAVKDRILAAIKNNAKTMEPEDLRVFQSVRRSFSGAAAPKARLIPWERLEKRLASAEDKGPLMRLLRRLVRRSRTKDSPGLGVIFVCTSNTCRSPMAEQIARQVFEDAGVEGVRFLSRGLPGPLKAHMARESAAAMERLGFAPDRGYISQGITPSDAAGADLILAMEDNQADYLRRLFPEAAPKIMLFNEFAGLGRIDIPDPMFGPAVGEDDGRAPVPPAGPSNYLAGAAAILEAARASLPRLGAFLRLKALDRKAQDERLEAVGNGKPSVLRLDEIDDGLKDLVGGKSAKLGEISLSARVPPGIALTRFAFERFLRENGIEAPDRKAVLAGRLHPDKGVGKEILDALRASPGSIWAVRSSAIQEDGDDAAFAGAAESALFVKPEDLLAKVVENWASFWLPRGILYRERLGMSPADIQPATLIQEMVPAEKSGVIFTQHPVTGRGEILINAVYGLGEGAVSGRADSDSYTLRKQDGTECELPRIARKRRRMSEAGISPVEKNLRTRRVLSREQTRALARAALSLEKRFGRPLDVEFSIHEGNIFILQARPITAPGAGS
jgi:protein-tyrosine-phosphatase/phosphohistidine swiveling domain-containing protein